MQNQIKQLPFRSSLSVLRIKTTSSLISAIDTILEQCGLATWLPIRHVDVYIVSSFFFVLQHIYICIWAAMDCALMVLVGLLLFVIYFQKPRAQLEIYRVNIILTDVNVCASFWCNSKTYFLKNKGTGKQIFLIPGCAQFLAAEKAFAVIMFCAMIFVFFCNIFLPTHVRFISSSCWYSMKSYVEFRGSELNVAKKNFWMNCLGFVQIC